MLVVDDMPQPRQREIDYLIRKYPLTEQDRDYHIQLYLKSLMENPDRYVVIHIRERETKFAQRLQEEQLLLKRTCQLLQMTGVGYVASSSAIMVWS